MVVERQYASSLPDDYAGSSVARMTTRGQRLRAARQAKGWTQGELAEASGVGQGVISKIERDAQGPTSFTVPLARALGASVDYIDEGIGDMFAAAPKPRVEAEPGPDIHLSTIPIVGDTQGGPDKYYIEYGYPTGYGDEVVDTPAKNPHTYGLRVRGSSMHPRMREGDVVTLDPEEQAMVGFDVVVRTADGEVMVKTLAYDHADEVALDSLTEPRRVVRKDQIEMMHVVVGIHPPYWVKKRS